MIVYLYFKDTKKYWKLWKNVLFFLDFSVYFMLKNVPKKCIPFLSGKFAKLWFQSIPYPNILIPLANSFYYTDLDLRNTSWKPECVLSFYIGWQILVFYPDPEDLWKQIFFCVFEI
jgi:hypothetical protein